MWNGNKKRTQAHLISHFPIKTVCIILPGQLKVPMSKYQHVFVAFVVENVYDDQFNRKVLPALQTGGRNFYTLEQQLTDMKGFIDLLGLSAIKFNILTFILHCP